MPTNGLFAGLEWRVSPTPFPLGEKLAEEIDSLGRVLLQFYRATNLLYRKSVEGKQPEWVSPPNSSRCSARRHLRTMCRA
jgi:hypothetical protein